MSLTQAVLIAARHAASQLLDQMGLENYLFEVEPRPGSWAVHIEHPRNGAWHEQTLVASERELLETLDDPDRRVSLANRWSCELGLRDAA